MITLHPYSMRKTEMLHLRSKKISFYAAIWRKNSKFAAEMCEAYDGDSQEIQTDFHGGPYRRDAAGTDGRCGEGCKGVECQGGGGEAAQAIRNRSYH